MQYRGSVATMVLMAAALCMPTTALRAFDDAIYPDLNGQWTRAVVPGVVGLPPFDPTKPPGRGQQAPLTPEYQAKFEANMAKDKAGQVVDPKFTCGPVGMPRAL